MVQNASQTVLNPLVGRMNPLLTKSFFPYLFRENVGPTDLHALLKGPLGSWNLDAPCQKEQRMGV